MAVEASGTGMSEAPAGNAVTVVARVGMLDSEVTGCGVPRLIGDPWMDVANNGISFDEAEDKDGIWELDRKEELEEKESTEELVNEDEGIDRRANGKEE